jgi:hypothetical protein
MRSGLEPMVIRCHTRHPHHFIQEGDVDDEKTWTVKEDNEQQPRQRQAIVPFYLLLNAIERHGTISATTLTHSLSASSDAPVKATQSDGSRRLNKTEERKTQTLNRKEKAKWLRPMVCLHCDPKIYPIPSQLKVA